MKLQLFFKKINTICLLIVFFLFFPTIVRMSVLMSQYHLLRKTEKEIKKLYRENQFLEDEFLKITSTSHLEEFLRERNFVKATSFKYIQAFESAAIAK